MTRPGASERKKSHLKHPIFGAWESVCKSLVQGKGKTITRKIENDHKCYEEKISYSKNNGLIHIYLRDITDKKQTVESLVQQLVESQADRHESIIIQQPGSTYYLTASGRCCC